MKKTKSEILNKEFNYKPQHLILTVNDDLWLHDKWNVRINNETFEYSTGIGHRTTRSKEGKRLMKVNPKQTKGNLLTYAERLTAETQPTRPKIDDVLYSLIMDSDALDMTFKDWCDTFGYNSDSKSDESIYNACLQNAEKVKSLGIDIDEARESFQNY